MRAPFGVADVEGLLPVDRHAREPHRRASPLRTVGGGGEPIEVPRHAEGLPRAYYPLRVHRRATPGIYTGRTEIDGTALEMAIKVDPAEDVEVIQVGAPMPAMATPTTADAQGVDPICTNDPVCPLHGVTVAEALAAGRPSGLLVATPAFCQIAICGPVLDVLLAVAADHPDVELAARRGLRPPRGGPRREGGASSTSSGSPSSPAWCWSARTARSSTRLDTIFDEVEVNEALARLT